METVMDHDQEALLAYEDYQEGLRLLEAGDARAAVVVLERARAAEPEKDSIRETLARAYYHVGRFRAACAEFTKAVEIDPVNDYAHFGLGLCLLRAGERGEARGHLRMAAVMRPERDDYREALLRATDEEPEALGR